MTADAYMEGVFDEYECHGNGQSQFQSRSSLSVHAAEPDPLPDSVRAGLPCPVHGEILLPAEVSPLLHTEPVLRLKRLRQLGACSLVRRRSISPRQSLAPRQQHTPCPEACTLTVHLRRSLVFGQWHLYRYLRQLMEP
jgi:hypothetical protein